MNKQALRLAALRAASSAAGADTALDVATRTQAREWFKISNKAGDGGKPAELYIYDEIGFWGMTAGMLVDQLKEVTAGAIDLHVNSPGGEVFDGIAIFNALRSHKATVTTYIDGLAASAASFIALAGDTVKIARNAQMMIHDAAGICLGNASDMREMATLLDKCSDNIADIYAERVEGTSVGDWRAAMREETWYSADEAVSAGLADEVFGSKAKDGGDSGGDGSADKAKADFDLSIFRYAGRREAPAPTLTRRPAPATELTPAEVNAQIPPVQQRTTSNGDVEIIVGGFKDLPGWETVAPLAPSEDDEFGRLADSLISTVPLALAPASDPDPFASLREALT